MNFLCVLKYRLGAAALLPLLLSFGCKTNNESAIKADDFSVESIDDRWVLLPNSSYAIGSKVTNQLIDPKNPSAPVQVCIYFDRTTQLASPGVIAANAVQIWLERGEFCGDAEEPNSSNRQHQFLGLSAVEAKDLTSVAWILYLDKLPIGNATIDGGTGLPMIQSLCSGNEFAKACHLVGTPDSLRVAPGA